MREGLVFVRPAAVPEGAFAFCRWSLALLLWAALLLGQPWLVLATGAVLLASAILGIARAPMIVLWRATLHRAVPTGDAVLDANAMRFAHALGAALCGVTFALLLAAPLAGRIALVLLVALKTVGALGYCTASRLYACITTKPGCCRLSGGPPVRGC